MDVILSDSIRRLICRLGFLILCVLPSLLVIRWILFPLTSHDWSLRFQQQVGLPVNIERIRSASPNQIEFFCVEIGHNDCDSKLVVDRIAVTNSASGRVISINRTSGTVRAIWQCLRQITENATWYGSSNRPILVQMAELEVLENGVEDGQKKVIKNVRVQVLNGGRQLTVEIGQWSEIEDKQANSVTINCQPDHSGTIEWRIDTRDARIPGWIVLEIAPHLGFLNKNAFVSGSAKIKQIENDWNTVFNGMIGDIDLSHVVYRSFGQPMSGSATAAIQFGKMTNGRINELRGHIECEQGEIGPRLLQACHQWLSMEIVPGRGINSESFRDLYLEFEIKNYQLSLSSFASDGEVLRDPNGSPLVITANGRQHPIANLVSLLGYPMNQGFSLTRQTVSLANHLALPQFGDTNRFAKPQVVDKEIGSDRFFR